MGTGRRFHKIAGLRIIQTVHRQRGRKDANLDLRPLFEKYGTVVECDVVKNYGFVHMENKDQGRDAINNLDGNVVNGKAVKVEAARNCRPPNNTEI